MNENIENPKSAKILTVRLGKEEEDMIKYLKSSPHFINISEYIRATIRHLYESKSNKAGRIK